MDQALKKFGAGSPDDQEIVFPPGPVDPLTLFETSQRITTNITRLLTIHLRTAEKLDAYTVVSDQLSSFDQEHEQVINGVDVLKIAVALPLPHEYVSWEQISEYRKDPESRNRLRELQEWMSETARGKLTPIEIQEKLGDLLERHRQHFENHQMKTYATSFEAFIVSTGDVVKNLATLRWGNKAQALFTLLSRKLALLDGELTSEGSVVAYVTRATLFQ